MKKAVLSLLLILSLFLCVCIGVSIGRSTLGARTEISYALVPETTEPLIASAAMININTATAEELMTLPGVGEVLANRIIAYRATKGLFTSVDDLILVDGIGTGVLDRMRDQITVGG